MWEASWLVFTHVIVPTLVGVGLLVVATVIAIGAWLSWWLVRIKDTPGAIMTDCRDEDCNKPACIKVFYSRDDVDLKCHGSAMNVVKTWRHAVRVGIVHEEVTS